MRALGVHKLYVLDDRTRSRCRWRRWSPSEAEAPGIAVAAHDSIVDARRERVHGRGRRRSRAAERRRCSSPAAAGPARWRCGGRCTAPIPHLLLLGLERARRPPAIRLGDRRRRREHVPDDAAAGAGRLSAGGARVLADYRRQFGGEAGRLRAVRLRGDERRARRDPPGRRARQRSPGGDRPLLRDARPRLGARALLDRPRRRNDALALRRRPHRRPGAPVLRARSTSR